ncbi:MAG: disulfide oxidoreductase, partial [Rhodospirillaceae bacterium]|nr:disulfide oxidoreductase [Rhodospirillaceae bacterium]
MNAPPYRRVTAVLGPTNTGKTYLAIERMLGHRSGMIGFPLRLLARENYDRIVRLKGARAVALITGEEKIVPPHPSYFVCTVESMPLDRRVAFLAVDEVQLAADPERGHVFTHRLLHARGEEETMFLGADTIRPLIRRLVPEAEFLSRPRFSTLAYTGERKLTRLPPRTAVVAFSAAEVYALAEVVRRQRGGTAVVMGALSPRTRNAQVALYQGGEVDYMVATDAIGMGLNMDLDHVAFARLDKFDGRHVRRLAPAELAQIAGRAGRHMSDGSFGTTAEAGPLDPELVEAVESHRFDPLRFVYWRNDELDFRGPGLLLKSLERRPEAPWLRRAREADDQMALAALARDPEVIERARHPQGLRLLWEVCQIPDFRKVMSDAHTRLLGQVFRFLTRPVAGGGDSPLPDDWVAAQIARIDRTDGDIDTLMARIAHIRTWTYISHRPGWLRDPVHWQERARDIEDRLSDALHQSLTQRFVDRRHAVLVRKMRGGELMAAVTRAGEVVVEGHPIGRLDGFRFVPEASGDADGLRALMRAARRAMARDLPGRLLAFERDGDEAFALDPRGLLLWQGAPVARLVRGETPLAPQIEPLASDLLDNAGRERLRRRLAVWLRGHLDRRLAPLVRLQAAPLAGPARGLAFQLVEALGCLPRRAAAAQLRALSREDRRALTGLGVRLGVESVWVPALLRGGRP